jgi:histidinol-phosphate aminotransferase
MTSPIDALIPEYIRGLPVYVPGRPLEEVERELKIRAVKLASNENPLGPSPKAVEAVLREARRANRYPDGGSKILREQLAQLHGVSPDEIVVGLGSSEIIDLVARVLLHRGAQGVTSAGSYAPFSTAIRASGADLRLAPLHDYTYDLNALVAAITPATRVIYIANPNNPTGTAFGSAEWSAFVSRVPEDVAIVLDEAYIHYAARPDMPRSIDTFRARKNIVIMRTFSKVYGLAGLRVGYGIAGRELAAAMHKLRTPFNVTSLGQAAALAALGDAEHVRASIETNARERAGLIRGLQALGFAPVPSETNFVFLPVGTRAENVSASLLRNGIIVRPLGWMGFPDAMRVTVGTPEENEKFLASWSAVRREAAP